MALPARINHPTRGKMLWIFKKVDRIVYRDVDARVTRASEASVVASVGLTLNPHARRHFSPPYEMRSNEACRAVKLGAMGHNAHVIASCFSHRPY